MNLEIFKNIELFASLITGAFTVLVLLLSGIGLHIKNKITSSQEESRIKSENSHEKEILEIEQHHEIPKEISKEKLKKRQDSHEKIN